MAPPETAPIVRDLLIAATQQAQAAARAVVLPYGPIEPGRPGAAATMQSARARLNRSGRVDLGVLGQGALGAGRFLAADLANLPRQLVQVHAALSAVGHAGMLAFNRLGAGLRAVERGAGRLVTTFAPLGRLLATPFHLLGFAVGGAGRALGLFDARAATTTNLLRVLGRTTAAPIRLPVAAASQATEALSSSFNRLAQMAQWAIGGILIKKVGDYVWEAAKADDTTRGLAYTIQEKLTAGSSAMGQALQPAFQEILALVVELQGATAGVTPLFVRVAQAVGGTIKDAVHFVRQMITNWRDAQEFLGLVFLQLMENAGTAVRWIGEAFAAFLDWLSSNWRNIFHDLFEVVTKGVQNLIENLKNLGTAFIKWVKDPLNAPFEFEFKSLLTGVEIKAEGLKLPGLSLPDSYAEKMGAVLARILGARLPDPQALVSDAARKKVAEEDAEKKDRSRAGQLIGARELVDMLNASNRDQKEDSKNHKKTADNTGKALDHLKEIGKRLGQGIAGVMG